MADAIDSTDRSILYALQQDARNNSNADISDRIGVSASTVGKRIASLEDRGIIRGYRPKIDYELAGLPFDVLLICTVPITDRESLVDSIQEIDGVGHVREMMAGQQNVHVRVVGQSHDDIIRVAAAIDDWGYDITDEIVIRTERHFPVSTLLESNTMR